jgi:hypothetical protein
VREWTRFLKDHRPPKSWCRTTPDLGYLAEEGYGSTVLYRQATGIRPRWLRDQGDLFREMILKLDAMARAGNAGARDAARKLTEATGAYSYLPGFLGGRFGRAGPGANRNDVRELLLQYVQPADLDGIRQIRDYLQALRSTGMPQGVARTTPGTGSRSGHAWYDRLRPSYERLLQRMDEVAEGSRFPSVIDKIDRVRDKMDMSDGVYVPGTHVRLLRGQPGVPPTDLRDWLGAEHVQRQRSDPPGAPAFAPWFNAARDYLDVVTETWRDVPAEVRHSGGCPSSMLEPAYRSHYSRRPRGRGQPY